ncbi:hypothetical protein IFM89_014370 [Coptis chinensis]|uniref:Uncharacterized protein n=1 Tax=Coptis chinensis TaxID=261450 RepID=A0A835GXE8_9MAGN|nr:hypothetical protein IFM89_014370 [Coptis chinensis]
MPMSFAREVKRIGGSSTDSSTKFGGALRADRCFVTFARFLEKHRRLLNAFIRRNPGSNTNNILLLHCVLVFIMHVLEDSYNQLRMRPTQDLKGRLTVQFQVEEGIDAVAPTRECGLPEIDLDDLKANTEYSGYTAASSIVQGF